jgi:hypothetical protein
MAMLIIGTRRYPISLDNNFLYFIKRMAATPAVINGNALMTRVATPGLKSPYNIAKYAMERIINENIPMDWWIEHGIDDTTRLNDYIKNLSKHQRKYNKYDEGNNATYRRFMNELERTQGFVRIVTQNMHCRDTGNPVASECAANQKFKDNQTERAVQFAHRINSGTTKAHVIAIQELQDEGAKKAFMDTINKEIFGYWFPISGAKAFGFSVPSGQGFVWDKTKVTLLEQKLWLFPTALSSGADAITRKKSFKGMAYAKFQLINGNQTFMVFNIHPSPYVQMSIPGLAAKHDIDIVTTHMYQFTLIAMKIREILSEAAPNGSPNHKDSTFFIVGDWNVNKYFQNGYSAAGLRTDVKVKQTPESGVMTFLRRSFARNPDRPYDTYLGRFMRKDGEVADKCFRDDVPFTYDNECDTACCGSEFLTVSEIMGAVPPTHLVSLSEHDEDIPAPYGGKYTWDALLNSVMFSPHWSGPSFQMLDHIVYSKAARIPLYAHTMTKRYLTMEPIVASEGPLSNYCRVTYGGNDTEEPYIYNLEELPSRFIPYSEETTVDNIDLGLSHTINLHNYVDVSDHYAVECIAVLTKQEDDNETEKAKINSIYSALSRFYKNAKYWPDSFFPDFTRMTATEDYNFRFMIPKIWQLLSNEFRTQKINNVKTSLGIFIKFSIAESEFPKVPGDTEFSRKIRYIVYRYYGNQLDDAQLNSVFGELPITMNRSKLNHYVVKMANRLLEREYSNRFIHLQSAPSKLRLGAMTCKKGKGKQALYDCEIDKVDLKNHAKAQRYQTRRIKIRDFNRGMRIGMGFTRKMPGAAATPPGRASRPPSTSEIRTVADVNGNDRLISPEAAVNTSIVRAAAGAGAGNARL